jgi:hypothetical protein
MAHTLSTTSSDSQVTKPKPILESIENNDENLIVVTNLDDVLFVYQSLT